MLQNKLMNQPKRRYRGICSIEGCGEINHAKRLCQKHWYRMRKHGNIHTILKLRGRGIEERFWDKVNKQGDLDCWEWVGAIKHLFQNGLSKLTNKEVIEIRSLYKSGGISQQKLGNMFNVCNQTINFIVNNKTWSHI